MKAANLYYTYIYLMNADQSKYGMLVENSKEQLSLGNNQYPISVDKAYEVLMVKRFDKKPKTHGDRNNNNQDGGGNQKHNFLTKNEEDSPTFNFVQVLQGKCFCCGKPGHKSPKCYHHNKPKENGQ